MSGGFAHEIRNALAGAKILMRKILHSELDKDGSLSMAMKNSEHLLDIFKMLRGEVDPNLFKQVAQKIKEIKDAEKTMEQLSQMAYLSIERSLDVTTTIMEYSKVGSQTKGDDLVDLQNLLTRFVEEQRQELESHRIMLSTDLNERLFVRGTESHFHSLFSNIILNAKEALLDDKSETKQEHSIRIASTVRERRVWISIKDNGIGIPADVKARIFEPFFSTKPATGTGLGLGMVAKYVAIYGGELTVNSEPGQWTEFVVGLPLEEDPAS
jgi:signal transduction histidine kinase